MRKPKSKKFIEGLRGRQPMPPILPPQKLSPWIRSKIVIALQDAKPIKTSEHFAYKDAQHKECCQRIAVALAQYRSKKVSAEDFVNIFMHQVREEDNA
jgi:hypothetical protein